jgi:hypothetical protein
MTQARVGRNQYNEYLFYEHMYLPAYLIGLPLFLMDT